MADVPGTNSRAKTFTLNSAATTNATVLKASPGFVFTATVNNPNAALRYLKLYDKATAPTVGTDRPALVLVLPIGGHAVISCPEGIRFSNGISMALTAGTGIDADSSAVAVNEHKVVVTYK